MDTPVIQAVVAVAVVAGMIGGHLWLFICGKQPTPDAAK